METLCQEHITLTANATASAKEVKQRLLKQFPDLIENSGPYGTAIHGTEYTPVIGLGAEPDEAWMDADIRVRNR